MLRIPFLPDVVGLFISPEGGVPKIPVARVKVNVNGLEGDKQKYTKIHGGPERAVCLYCEDCLIKLQKEGHSILPGSVGENILLAGITQEQWATVKVGQILSFAEVTLRIKKFVPPCSNIKGSFFDGNYSRISQDKNPGWSRLYATVEKEGWLENGDMVDFEEGKSP